MELNGASVDYSLAAHDLVLRATVWRRRVRAKMATCQVLDVLVLVCGAVVAVSSGRVATCFILLTLGFSIIALFVKEQATSLHLSSGRLRRRAQLVVAFGWSVEVLDAVEELAVAAAPTQKELKEFERGLIGDYYSTQAVSPASRLADIVQEGAFYSSRLFSAAAKEARTATIASATVLGYSFLAGAALGPMGALQHIARLLVSIALFCVTANYFSTYSAWRWAAQTCERIDRRIEMLGERDDIGEPILAVFADYTMAHTVAKPVSYRIYGRMHADLHADWHRRRGA